MSILGNVQVEHMKVEHKVEHSSSTGPTQVEHIHANYFLDEKKYEEKNMKKNFNEKNTQTFLA